MERFTEKYTVDASGCWNWIAGRIGTGYGLLRVSGKAVLSHRWSYEHHTGKPIPPGLVIDHLCRNPRCVNPAHLECVTMRVNTERGVLYQTLTANAKNRTHCKRGHELFGDNLLRDSRGHRACRSCRAEHAKEWSSKNRERVNALQRIRRENAPKMARTPIYRDCPNCHTTFAIRRSDQIHCSNACMKKAWRKRTCNNQLERKTQ